MPAADALDLLSSFSIDTTLNMIYMLIKQFPDELNKILFVHKLSLKAKRTQTYPSPGLAGKRSSCFPPSYFIGGVTQKAWY